MGYKHPRIYRLTPHRKRIGKAVARGSKKAMVEECFKDPVMKKYLVETVGRIVRSELIAMCSVKVSSILLEQSEDVYGDFIWDKIHAEMEVNTPVLLSIFQACTHTRRPRINRKAVIGMCAAILLKYRFFKMSLVQRIISLILYAGHSGKQVNLLYSYPGYRVIATLQVFQRLQRLNLCMSHQLTSKLITTIGRGFDAKVYQWKHALLSEVEATTDSDVKKISCSCQ